MLTIPLLFVCTHAEFNIKVVQYECTVEIEILCSVTVLKQYNFLGAVY